MTTNQAGAELIDVEVVYALPERYWSLRLRLPCGSAVSTALQAARDQWIAGVSENTDVPPEQALREADSGLAIFGQAVQPETRMRDGDRLEILRPLLADPKQRRRERAVRPAMRRTPSP
ncbi:MAG: RnfH family protein [Arenimonas sp.]